MRIELLSWLFGNCWCLGRREPNCRHLGSRRDRDGTPAQGKGWLPRRFLRPATCCRVRDLPRYSAARRWTVSRSDFSFSLAALESNAAGRATVACSLPSEDGFPSQRFLASRHGVGSMPAQICGVSDAGDSEGRFVEKFGLPLVRSFFPSLTEFFFVEEPRGARTRSRLLASFDPRFHGPEVRFAEAMLFGPQRINPFAESGEAEGFPLNRCAYDRFSRRISLKGNTDIGDRAAARIQHSPFHGSQ